MLEFRENIMFFRIVLKSSNYNHLSRRKFFFSRHRKWWAHFQRPGAWPSLLLNGTDVIQTESPANFVVIFEIFPIDKEWKITEITYCRSWTSCDFNDRNATLQVDFFSHIDYIRTWTLQPCFVLPNKIRIQFLFHSHSVVDYLNYC